MSENNKTAEGPYVASESHYPRVSGPYGYVSGVYDNIGDAYRDAKKLNRAFRCGEISARASIPDPAALVEAMRQCVEAMEDSLTALPSGNYGDRIEAGTEVLRIRNTVRDALSAAKAAMGEA